MKKTFFLALLACFALPLSPTFAQEAEAQAAKRPSPLDERGGIPIPRSIIGLKNVSLTFWLKFRNTNQPLYNYVNEASEFHAYLNVCKRHELTIRMDLIMKQANQNLQLAIPSHYDEPEFGLLAPLSKAEQQAFLDDMSSDLFAFEYGRQVAILDAKLSASGLTALVYCEAIKNDYFKKYVALLATAKKNFDE